MKERPILFSAPMVRAILEGRKTQTRRVVKPQPGEGLEFRGWISESTHPEDEGKGLWSNRMPCASHVVRARCPYGKVGDWLWVRENGWQPPQLSSRDLREGADTWPKYIYDADASDESEWCREHQWKRRPSIHMPRWASRILLEITEVRVERLNEISETDALAEGIEKVIRPQPNGDVWHTFVTSGVPTNLHYYATARQAFRQLWQKINGPNSWEVNPWVWVVSFNRVESPI